MATVTASALRELHRIHRQLSDLRGRIDRGPKQIRAREGNVARLQEQVEATKQKATDARMAVDRKQLDLKSSENKVLDLKTKLNSCSNNKEYQALLEQIAATEMAGSVLADEILEGLEKIDEHEGVVAEAEKQLAVAQADLEKLKAEVADKSEMLNSEFARVQAELEQAEAALPADFKEQYLRIVRAKGEDCLAQVEGESCGGCYQTLTPNIMNDLALGRAVFCKTCGRLIYNPEQG